MFWILRGKPTNYWHFLHEMRPHRKGKTLFFWGHLLSTIIFVVLRPGVSLGLRKSSHFDDDIWKINLRLKSLAVTIAYTCIYYGSFNLQSWNICIPTGLKHFAGVRGIVCKYSCFGMSVEDVCNQMISTLVIEWIQPKLNHVMGQVEAPIPTKPKQLFIWNSHGLKLQPTIALDWFKPNPWFIGATIPQLTV